MFARTLSESTCSARACNRRFEIRDDSLDIHDAETARVRVVDDLWLYQIAIDQYGQIVTQLILRLWVHHFA